MVDNWETDGRWMCLGDSGSSGLEGSVDLGVDWVVGESSVKNLVMSLRDNRGQWSGSSLPWQHLIFNLSNFFLEVTSLWWHWFPNWWIPQFWFSLPSSTQSILAFQGANIVCPEFCLLCEGDVLRGYIKRHRYNYLTARLQLINVKTTNTHVRVRSF